MWELMSRKIPYENILLPAIAPTIVKGGRPSIDVQWDETVCQVMKNCWDQNPSNRPSIKSAR